MNINIEKPNAKGGKRSFIGIFAILAAFTLVVGFALIPASARTIYVDDDRIQYPSADYSGELGVWNAVNNASAGDTVYVYPGTYKPPYNVNYANWSLIINKPLSIIGIDRPVIDANGYIGALKDLPVINTRITHGGSSNPGYYALGLIRVGSSNVNIKGFKFTNFSSIRGAAHTAPTTTRTRR